MSYLLTWRDRLVTPTTRKIKNMMLIFMEDTNKNNIELMILLDKNNAHYKFDIILKNFH